MRAAVKDELRMGAGESIFDDRRFLDGKIH